MAHGIDTDELLLRMANIQDGDLNLTKLQITSLPPLPAGLRSLWCLGTQLTSLPDLPPGLEYLNIRRTNIVVLPEYSAGLTLWCDYCPNLAVQYIAMERKQQYHARWQAEWSKRRCQERCSVIKEDLMAECWHPRSVAKLLEQGGWELVDSYWKKLNQGWSMFFNTFNCTAQYQTCDLGPQDVRNLPQG